MQARPFASLSSGLLARKGAAKPAMRPQSMGQLGSGLEDLGWNDMGSAAPARPPVVPIRQQPVEEQPEAFEPAPPVVEQQRAAIAASFAEPAEERIVLSAKPRKPIQEAEPQRAAETPKPQSGATPKAAFTLRLEAERHLKLRLACAVTGRSAQQLVTEALDEFLQSRPDIAALAEQVPANPRKPG
ncbi:MAG TPA: hypothetical protein VGR19_00295 [Allosphingosinicella sp.]|nr:hypothetical protein [Allosphingosinicella sp.]